MDASPSSSTFIDSVPIRSAVLGGKLQDDAARIGEVLNSLTE